MEAIETINLDGYTIEIFPCDSPESPRDRDNLGTMIIAHRRYDFGDVNCINQEALDREKRDIDKKAVRLPIYMYDHGGITLSASPFSCPWDSGKVGEIYCNPDKIREEYKVKRITEKIRKQVYVVLAAEIRVMDHYVSGDVYGYVVSKDGEEMNSCWGFYGLYDCVKEAKDCIEHLKRSEVIRQYIKTTQT